MKFKIKDKRICDYLDYYEIGKTIGLNNGMYIENNGIDYHIKYEKMTPLKYIRSCAEMMGISVERLISSRNDDSLKKLYPNINQDNYGIIYIDNFNKMQDGLHRAIILMMKRVPSINVLVIRKIN